MSKRTRYWIVKNVNQDNLLLMTLSGSKHVADEARYHFSKLMPSETFQVVEVLLMEKK